MKSTVWIFSLEPIETRYTGQWQSHIPALLAKHVGDMYKIVQIDGVQKNSQLTPGAFLNFSDTNYWKSSQLCKFLEHHNNGETSPTDHIIFTDAWNPTVIQLKYMKELLGFKWTLHGLWHAGNYDPQDFLGRLIRDRRWVQDAELSFFESFDHNYFATDFHINMFFRNLLHVEEKLGRIRHMTNDQIVRTGWPMEYMAETLAPFKREKKDLILFPHRIAPEKQVDIFKDLAKQLPQYEFVVCQEQNLSKDGYHELLGQAKMVFSANLQETLGISCYEGALLGAIPCVPDRLSYSEMYYDKFKYPSSWTESFVAYEQYKQYVCKMITNHMENYGSQLSLLEQQTQYLTDYFFNANELIKRF